MCIICFSPKGNKLPTEDRLRTMFSRNPDGAGVMVARGDHVECHKGYMTIDDFLAALKSLDLTEDDAVGYHFRISTQAGVNPSMTHPFPLSSDLSHMTYLDYTCGCGIMHNGIIRMTSNGDKRYSDTALYITKYLVNELGSVGDFTDVLANKIYNQTSSRLLLLDGSGKSLLVGRWITADDGNSYSNGTYVPYVAPVYTAPKWYGYRTDEQGYVTGYWDEDEDDDDKWWSDYKNWWKSSRDEPVNKRR